MSAHGEKRSMPYVRLGTSGLKISRLVLGCMSYGERAWGDWLLGERDGVAHIQAAYAAGINAFDTANVYSNGASERILGTAIRELALPRDEIVIMTKLHGPVGKTAERVRAPAAELDRMGYVNQHGLSRKHIFDSVKHSLERLQLDYIDLLQCHRFDPNTPIEETMQALHDVVKAGWVRYIGMSSCYAYQFHQMQNYAITHGLTPFISMQNHYNVLYREEEREMMPTLKLFGVGALPWSPLARGVACRPWAATTARTASDPLMGMYAGMPGAARVVGAVEALAQKRGVSMAQAALAWVLAKDGVSAPIVGTTSLANLHELIEAVHLQLTEEEIASLEEPYQPQKIAGHQ